MGNPYQPRRYRIAQQSESPRDLFLRRLVRLGAGDEEVSAVREHWDDFNDDWTPQKRAELMAMSDAQLLALLTEVDDEYDEATTTEEVTVLADHAAAVEAAEVEAYDHMNDTVAGLLGWVGGNRVRAMAVLNLEQSPDGSKRVTLIDALNKVIDGAA